MKCIVCSRPLQRSASTTAAIGPKCLAKLRPAPRPKRVQVFDRAVPQVDPRQVDWVKEATA